VKFPSATEGSNRREFDVVVLGEEQLPIARNSIKTTNLSGLKYCMM
jgi:hypothetical protein